MPPTIIHQLLYPLLTTILTLLNSTTAAIYTRLIFSFLSLIISHISWPNIFTIYLMIISVLFFESGIPSRASVETLLESFVVLAGMKQFGKSVRWLAGGSWRGRHRVLASLVFVGCCFVLEGVGRWEDSRRGISVLRHANVPGGERRSITRSGLWLESQ